LINSDSTVSQILLGIAVAHLSSARNKSTFAERDWQECRYGFYPMAEPPSFSHSTSARTKLGRINMSKMLHIQRLPSSTTDTDLQGLFEGVGHVVHCDLIADSTTRCSKAIGFAEMGYQAETRRGIDKLNEKLQAEILERKRLEHEVVRASEREQIRLGQELHDGVAQHFIGIAFQMSAFHDALEKISSPLAPQALRLEKLIRDGVNQTRELAHGFYPVGLENLGLTTALEELAIKTQQVYRVACGVESDGGECDKLDGATALEIFRIAQEAVTNSVKHARAKRIVITLRKVGRTITLVIRDNGIGLPPFKGSSSTGIGLRIMKHRAHSIGGELDYRNHKNGGAMVTCTVC
jgi:signal transduction histidine kinase